MAAERQVNDVLVYRDSAGFYRERPIAPEVDALAASVAAKADVALIPLPATTMPQAEVNGAAVGVRNDRFARADHQHPRLVSATYATLDGAGIAIVPFTRTFVNKPGVVLTEVDQAGGQPLVCLVLSWIRETMTPTPSGAYTGCVIKGYRSQVLPALTPINTGLALVQTIVAINALHVTLTNFNAFGGSPAGASVSVIAIARSDVVAT